jgi:hypothetical protein
VRLLIILNFRLFRTFVSLLVPETKVVFQWLSKLSGHHFVTVNADKRPNDCIRKYKACVERQTCPIVPLKDMAGLKPISSGHFKVCQSVYQMGKTHIWHKGR